MRYRLPGAPDPAIARRWPCQARCLGDCGTGEVHRNQQQVCSARLVLSLRGKSELTSVPATGPKAEDEICGGKSIDSVRCMPCWSERPCLPGCIPFILKLTTSCSSLCNLIGRWACLIFTCSPDQQSNAPCLTEAQTAALTATLGPTIPLCCGTWWRRFLQQSALSSYPLERTYVTFFPPHKRNWLGLGG